MVTSIGVHIDGVGLSVSWRLRFCLLCWLVPVQLGWAGLSVEDAYVRGQLPGKTVTVAFMTLVNSGVEPLRVLNAQTPVAERVEFHTHSHEGGMMSMRQVDELVVPGGGELRLESGHLHLMLIGLRQVLSDGDQVSLQLCGEGFSCVELTLPVVSVLNE